MANRVYLQSSDVQVFPFGTTRDTDRYSRILNEQTIVRLVRSIVDNDSYVISFDPSSRVVEFLLSGYYFKCKLSEAIYSDSTKALYAGLKLTSIDDDNGHIEYLRGADEAVSNKFTGVEFSHLPFDSDYKCLQILDAGHQVPYKSYLKFNADSVEGAHGYDRIVCGTASTIIDEETDGIILINSGDSKTYID